MLIRHFQVFSRLTSKLLLIIDSKMDEDNSSIFPNVNFRKIETVGKLTSVSSCLYAGREEFWSMSAYLMRLAELDELQLS